jgi:hypothetical protein
MSRHGTVSQTDAKFWPNLSLDALTEKQRRILRGASKLGYYDVPRRVSSRQSSKKLGLNKPAPVTHRRKTKLCSARCNIELIMIQYIGGGYLIVELPRSPLICETVTEYLLLWSLVYRISFSFVASLQIQENDWHRSSVDIWDKPFTVFDIVSVFVSEFLQQRLLLYSYPVDCKGDFEDHY